MPGHYVKEMEMKSLYALLLVVAVPVFASPATTKFKNEVEKARIDHTTAIKECKAQKKEPVKVCTDRVDGYFSAAQRGFKAQYLGLKK